MIPRVRLNHFSNMTALEGLIPVITNCYDTKSIIKSAKLYREDIERSELQLKAEINLWKINGRKFDIIHQLHLRYLEYCNDFFQTSKYSYTFLLSCQFLWQQSEYKLGCWYLRLNKKRIEFKHKLIFFLIGLSYFNKKKSLF